MNSKQEIKLLVKHPLNYALFNFKQIDIPPDFGLDFLDFLDTVQDSSLFTFDSIHLKVFLDFEIGEMIMQRIMKMNVKMSKVFPQCGPTSELRFSLPFMNPYELLDDTTSNPYSLISSKIKDISMIIPKIIVRTDDNLSLNFEMCKFEVTEKVKQSLKCIEFDTVAEFPLEPKDMISYLKEAFPLLNQLLFTNIPIDLSFMHIHKHRVFIKNMLKCGSELKKKFGISIYPQSPMLQSYTHFTNIRNKIA